MQGRCRTSDLRQHLDVVLERLGGMEPADNVDFARTFGFGLSGSADNLRNVHHVSVGIFLRPAECAESAPILADICIVYVAVNYVVGRVAVLLLPDEISHQSD